MKLFRCFFIMLLGSVAGASSPVVMAQSCNSKIATTSPTQRFHDNQDGSVTDQQTGLQWSRCSLGQYWEDNTCLDEPRALPYAIAALAVEEGWRLPSISELSSLVELRCSAPAINNKIFPATTPAAYWTATRFINRDGYFWQVHFLHGEGIPEKADSMAYVRWVRGK